MYNESFEQFFKTNNNFMTPINQWNKAATELCQRITQQNMELFGENSTRISKQMKKLSSIKNPKDYFEVLRDCLNEDIAATVQNVNKLIHHTLETTEEFSELCGTMCESAMPKTHTHKEKSGKHTDTE